MSPPSARSRAALAVRALAAAGLLATLGSATACGGSSSSAGSARLVSVAARQPAPTLSGTTLDGQPFSSRNYAGHVVVVNFWASWCGPCEQELPVFAGLAGDESPKGVRFLGVVIRDNAARADAVAQRVHLPYPSLFDRDGSLLLNWAALPPAAVPSTIVLDKRGRIAARFLGQTEPSELLPMLARLSAESA